MIDVYYVLAVIILGLAAMIGWAIYQQWVARIESPLRKKVKTRKYPQLLYNGEVAEIVDGYDLRGDGSKFQLTLGIGNKLKGDYRNDRVTFLATEIEPANKLNSIISDYPLWVFAPKPKQRSQLTKEEQYKRRAALAEGDVEKNIDKMIESTARKTLELYMRE